MEQKMKTRLSKEIEKRLTMRWVMSLANYLQWDCDLPQREAAERAHLARELLCQLGRGEVVFTYRKADGWLRRARGTLCVGLSTEFDHYAPSGRLIKREQADGDLLTYWDLDRRSWRSFHARNLLGIDSVTIHNHYNMHEYE